MINSVSYSQTNHSNEVQHHFKERNFLGTRSRMRVLKVLNESNQKCIEEKENKLRCRAIQEIITTEKTYLHQLEIIMKFFLQPILDQNLVNHSLFFTLYENVKTLYNISLELIQELTKDSENISVGFHKLAPFFKLYSVYACDYQQVLTLLETAEQTSSDLKNFITKQETRPEVGRKLPSLLITPIQRVPRYKLLLKEVLQYTPAKHKEHIPLQICLAEVEKAAMHINTLISQHENTQNLLELQRHITNPINLVKPSRKLLKHGTLMRVSRGGKSSYKRYFILLSDTLLYCKGNPNSSLTIRCMLPLNKCIVKSILSGGLFSITCLNERLLLYSENNDSQAWLEALQNSIKKYKECRQTLKKDSSSRIPLRHNDVNYFTSENLPKKFNKRKRCKDEEDIVSVKEQEHLQKQDICLPILKKLKGNKENIKDEEYNRLTNIDSEKVNEDSEMSREDSFNDQREMDEKLNSLKTTISQQQSFSTTQVIGEFFTNVITSIKGLFNF